MDIDEELPDNGLASLLQRGVIQTAVVEICPELPDVHKKQFPLTPLTLTERRVLATLAQHDTIEDAASALCLSPGTVRKHLEHIYCKLGVHSLHRAIVVAIRCGLIQ
jgi:DNA-binding CsgD family transcriptional regulator